MIPLHRTAALLYNTPLYITVDAGQTLSGVLAPAILARMASRGAADNGERPEEQLEVFAPVARADGSAEVFSPRASRFVGQTPIDPATGRPMPYAVTPNGTGIISLVGELVNRGRWTGASSGVISYEGIKHQVALIGKDRSVKNVILDMEGPGGAAIGALDTAAAIRKLTAIKPVTAFLNGFGYSAMYGLASAATRIVCIPEGCLGSVGVLWMHVDFSVALQLAGIKPTYIFAGAHKVDGNPYEPLPAAVREQVQARIDNAYAMFVSSVAAGRKNLTEDAIRATEANIYGAADALKLGLIDSIGTFEDLLTEIEQPDTMTIILNEGDAKGNKTGALAAPEGENMDAKEIVKSVGASLKALMAFGAPDAEQVHGELIVGLSPKLLHVGADGKPLCGADDNGAGLTALVASSDCIACLHADGARRDAEAVATKAKETAHIEEQRVATEAARVAQIPGQADEILKKYELKGGKAWATEARVEIVDALTVGGDVGKARLERFEKMAAAMPDVGAVERYVAPEQTGAGTFVTEQEIAKEATRRTLAEGITERSPKWMAAYQKHVAAIVSQSRAGGTAA